MEGAVPLYNYYNDERTEERKHWHVRLKKFETSKSGNQSRLR